MLTEAQEIIVRRELDEYIAGVVYTVAVEQRVIIADVMTVLSVMWQSRVALDKIHELAVHRSPPKPVQQRRGNLKHLR
jgi:hypothetical protein